MKFFIIAWPGGLPGDLEAPYICDRDFIPSESFYLVAEVLEATRHHFI
ncbi:hypothetical protein PMI13_01813 [Chryseobacterium populi]|uniref:Uncharacterized protein n=1 Tax=Chryseobacterium populi TaxID=1144316 RepID=J3CJD4_9FLAO|nr:hypothetical protein PMI13_01813 [Chryseobacterium populi]